MCQTCASVEIEFPAMLMNLDRRTDRDRDTQKTKMATDTDTDRHVIMCYVIGGNGTVAYLVDLAHQEIVRKVPKIITKSD